ncbi:MAG TPA: hypothetical protein VGL22_14435 [Terracidiphilus sp.]|jgi:hypothetical protein
MGATLYTFESVSDTSEFWEMSHEELAEGCIRVAEGQFPQTRPLVRAEAVRLFLLWREAMGTDGTTCDEKERQAGMLAALRKRTIQVLIRVSLPPAAQIANTTDLYDDNCA